MKQLTFFLVLAVASLPVLASDPGEPLDATDVVVLMPGLSAATAVPPDSDLCATDDAGVFSWCLFGNGRETDNEGGLLGVRAEHLGAVLCGTRQVERWRHRIVRLRNGTEETLAYIENRCGSGNSGDVAGASGAGINFDDEYGRLYVNLTSTCDESPPPGECGYGAKHWVLKLDGFTTTFEILQTYQPTASEIGFRVPYMPEGFPAADYFDTYWGDLATVGDWSQAQPLQCGYPASPPSVGDYLTVEDDLPALEPGQGRYYVTAVHHQGQTRYGRKSSGGVLSGRDPAVLPGCSD
jgi:hypothetical protein